MSTPIDITLVATLDPSYASCHIPLTYSIVTPPTHGTPSGSPPNVTYTPNAGYSGPDSLTFKANDGQQDSNIATVSITVNPTLTITLDSLRLGQTIFNPDFNGDGIVDLVSGKAVAALPTLQISATV